MPTKSEEKIQVNNKRVKKFLHRPMVIDVGKGNKLKICCVVEDIEHQQKKEKMTELQRMKELAHPFITIG